MPIASYKENFKGTFTFVKVDPTTGHMNINFQILMPGFDYDLSHAGKGPSHDWVSSPATIQNRRIHYLK